MPRCNRQAKIAEGLPREVAADSRGIEVYLGQEAAGAAPGA